MRPRFLGRRPQAFDWDAFRDTFLGALANAHEEHRRTGSLEPLNEATRVWERILGTPALASPPPSFLGVLNDVAGIYLARHEAAGDPADLHVALTYFERLAGEAEPRSRLRGAALTNLCRALVARYRVTGEATDLDAAIGAQMTGLGEAPRDAPERPGYLNNLGMAVLARYELTGDLRDLERATEAFETAVRDEPRDSVHRPGLLSNLSHAFAERVERSPHPAHLVLALGAAEQALEEIPPGSPYRPMCLYTLARCLSLRFLIDGDQADLDRAVASLEEAIATLPPGYAQATEMLAALAGTLRQRYEARGDEADLERALELYREAQSRSPEGGDEYLAGLAACLRARYDRLGDPGDLEAGVAAYRSASDPRGHGPEEILRAASAWSEWALAREAWEEAVEAALLGLAAAEWLVQLQSARPHREAWLRGAAGLAGRAAFALAKTGDAEEAVMRLELGVGSLLSTQLLRDRLVPERLEALGRPELAERFRAASRRLGELDVAGADVLWLEPTGAGPELEAARAEMAVLYAEAEQVTREEQPERLSVADAAADEPLVYIVATEAGGVALVVDGGENVHTAWLDQLAEAAVERALFLLFEGANLPARVEATTRWLWDAVMEPLTTALGPVPAAVLIPVGPLGFLPLHAAWTEDAGTPTGRRYALDGTRFSYAPNAVALLHARRLAGRVEADSLLLVEEPQPVEAERLPNAAAEAELVGAEFPRVAHLRGAAATREAVLAALGEHPVLHFACHGEAVHAFPLTSGLLMAHDERLTVADVMAKHAEGVRLIALSACETSVPGADLPDEAIGLPSAFLQAGSAGVVGSLWTVPDAGTMLVMARFYDLWRRKGLSPAEALRRAQIWVRDATNAELEAALPALPALRGPEDERERATWAGQRPHAHPYHWAAFAYVGA